MAKWRDDSHDADWSVVFARGEKFRGTRGNDRLTGTDQADIFRIQQGGNDRINAAQGQDVIYVGASLTADDRITGGAGDDTLVLEGDYSSGLTLQTNTLSRIEHIFLQGDFDYDITLAPDMRHDFDFLVVDATSAQSFIFDGSAMNFGLNVVGSSGDDILTGGSGFNGLIPGAGRDVITGGVGDNQYAFFSTSDSLPSNSDVVTNFNDAGDQISLFEIDADTQKNGHQYFHFGATPGHTGDVTVTYDSGQDVTFVNVFTDSDAITRHGDPASRRSQRSHRGEFHPVTPRARFPTTHDRATNVLQRLIGESLFDIGGTPSAEPSPRPAAPRSGEGHDKTRFIVNFVNFTWHRTPRSAGIQSSFPRHLRQLPPPHAHPTTIKGLGGRNLCNLPARPRPPSPRSRFLV